MLPANVWNRNRKRGEGKAFAIVPLEIKDEGYDPKLVKRILEAERSAKEGNVTRIKDTSNIWADIL